MSEKSVELIRRSDEMHVDAKLLDGLVPIDLALIEREWSPERLRIQKELIRRGASRSGGAESLHWDWSQKAEELKLLEASGAGLECDGRWQGAILTKSASYSGRLKGQEGKPLVYVDYLETAPWNWLIPSINQAGTYKGVGVVLMRHAVELSEEQGFKGRLGLHALPQAAGFYQKVCGMKAVGPDPVKQGLPYFEFDPSGAKNFLKR